MRMCDAFCGAGGISDGAAAEGWEVIGIDVVRRPEYTHQLIHKDIQAVSAGEVGPVEWFHASPPCQRFSTARASRVVDPATIEDLALLQAALRLRDQLDAGESLEDLEPCPNAPYRAQSVQELPR